MIVPAGRSKKQVNQSEHKNTLSSIDSMLDKYAIGNIPGFNSPEQDTNLDRDFSNGSELKDEVTNSVDPQLQNVMNSGGLNRGDGGVSPYLVNNGDSEEMISQDADLLQERHKIQQVLGGGGFHMDLSRGKGADGSYTLKLAPEQGMQLPRENFDKLLSNLMSTLGAEAQSISDPDPRTGMVTITYRPKQIDKVMKPGRG